MEIECNKKKDCFTSIPALLIWLVAALGVPFQFVLQSTPNVMIVDLIHCLHVNETEIGFLTSSFFYTYLFFQIPAGMVVDRYGARIVLASSVLLGGLSCMLFAMADTLAAAELSRLLMGLVTAPCVPAVMYVAAKHFSTKKFTVLAGLAESIGMTGGAVGCPILGKVVALLGWRQTMMSAAIMGIGIACLMFALIRDKKEVAVEGPKQCLTQIVVGFGLALKNPQVWYIVLFGALTFAMLPALAGLWIVQTLQDLYRISLETATFGTFAMFFGTALGLPCWGMLSEYLRCRKPVLFIATLGNLLTSTSFIYFAPTSVKYAFVELFIMGFFSAVYVLAFALVREQTRECIRASAMGLTNMMSMVIGGLILQPLMGAILKNHQITGEHTLTDLHTITIAYQSALATVLICLFGSLVSICLIRETYCISQVEEPVLLSEIV